jgi:hypothetical protein
MGKYMTRPLVFLPIVISESGGNHLTDKLNLLANPPRDENRCGTAGWLANKDDVTREAIQTALDNKAWKSTDLHTLLKEEFGYALGYNQLTRHRNGKCCNA